MPSRYVLPVLAVVTFMADVNCNFNPFMDSIYFAIEWAGPELMKTPDDVTVIQDDDPLSMVVTTANNEKYHCLLPSVSDYEEIKDDNYGRATTFELDLLKPLFEQTTCTYRLEMYWTYELCHGKHLRQYHEEKEIGKKTKLTEYFLGRYESGKFQADYTHAKTEHEQNVAGVKRSYQKKKVQGIEIPYYEVSFDDGTVCDLTGQPRRAAIHYVCQPDGRGEIYELKETSSCEYEVIVLTHLLCVHPIYGPKKESVSTIHCHSLSGSPPVPLSVGLLDDSRERYNSKEDSMSSEEQQPPQVKLPPDFDDEKFRHVGERADKEFIRNFLLGDECIHGGTGWWKYEFCYGKHVKQYHEEKYSKVVVILGEWDTSAHLLWISNNPKKKPTPPTEQRKSISHFYGGGNICDLTGRHRFVEVKLSCIEGTSSQHGMSIYLVEPKTCQYKLVVESPLLCPIIILADETGLIKIPDES